MDEECKSCINQNDCMSLEKEHDRATNYVSLEEYVRKLSEAAINESKNAVSPKKNNNVINVLGTEYTITFFDERSNDNGGEVDLYRKQIKVYSWKNDENASDKEKIIKHCLRHEIIYAFLFESGLNDNCFNQEKSWPINKEMIDWFAMQYPKIKSVFKKLDIKYKC